MSVRVFAPAKINLTLQVGKPRADGLHPLQSVVAFADVGDWVEAEAADDITLTIHGPFARDLTANGNLVLAAAQLLAKDAGITGGAKLTLEKNLPIASGIGGGSSDAAAALRALNELWGVSYPEARLAEIARALGADVPICIGARASYMTGAGDTFAPVSLPPLLALLINPGKALATSAVYHRFDLMSLGDAFVSAASPAWRDRIDATASIAAIGNDLEAPAHALMPDLARMAAVLRAEPRIQHAGLSGSGATMFALVQSSEIALALQADLSARFPQWWVRATQIGAPA